MDSILIIDSLSIDLRFELASSHETTLTTSKNRDHKLSHHRVRGNFLIFAAIYRYIKGHEMKGEFLLKDVSLITNPVLHQSSTLAFNAYLLHLCKKGVVYL